MHTHRQDLMWSLTWAALGCTRALQEHAQRRTHASPHNHHARAVSIKDKLRPTAARYLPHIDHAKLAYCHDTLWAAINRTIMHVRRHQRTISRTPHHETIALLPVGVSDCSQSAALRMTRQHQTPNKLIVCRRSQTVNGPRTEPAERKRSRWQSHSHDRIHVSQQRYLRTHRPCARGGTMLQKACRRHGASDRTKCSVCWSKHLTAVLHRFRALAQPTWSRTIGVCPFLQEAPRCFSLMIPPITCAKPLALPAGPPGHEGRVRR